MRYTLALVLMLLVVMERSLVLSSPGPKKCVLFFDATENLTNLLHRYATDLMKYYIQYNSITTKNVPDEVPTSSVTGSNVIEKLQNIYTKNALFKLHLLQTEDYQKGLLPEEFFNTLKAIFTEIEGKLTHQGHGIVKILKCVDPRALVPISPPSLHLDISTDYAKKVYGHGVIFRLIKWLNEVKRVLKEANGKSITRN